MYLHRITLIGFTKTWNPSATWAWARRQRRGWESLAIAKEQPATPSWSGPRATTAPRRRAERGIRAHPAASSIAPTRAFTRLHRWAAELAHEIGLNAS